MARILLTGFEPFGDNPENVSEKILNMIGSTITVSDPWHDSRKSKTTYPEIEVTIEKQLLTVDQAGSVLISDRISNGEKWDAIVHMGLCESCDSIQFETTAKNLLDMKIPDNLGRQTSSQKLGDTDLYCNKALKDAISYPSISGLKVSNDAGSFLCNETYFRTLESLKKINQSSSIKTCFIHIPSEDKVSLDSSTSTLKKIIARFFYKPVLEVVGALLIRNEKIMLARRNSVSKLAGNWEFPGGKVENDESYFLAIQREMMEEFNWEVIPIRFVSSNYHEYTDLAINLHIVEVKVEIDELESNRTLWTSHDKIGWFENLTGINIAPADYELALSIFKMINAK